MKKLIIILLTLNLLSCVPVEEEPISSFDVPLKWSNVKGSSEWDDFITKALEEHGQELLDSVPNDIEDFSKNYKNMDYNSRINFWSYLISIMAERESNFDPDAKYTEAFNDAQGNPVISRGLLQLSIESSRGYDCPLANAQDLHDPELNLICTVFILRRWVINDGVISGRTIGGSWRGGARYWSVLRKSTTLDYFKDHTLERF